MNVEVDKVEVAETPNNIATFALKDFDFRKERIRRAALNQWADPLKRKNIHNAIIEANKDPVLREARSIRMQMDNPMSKREVVDKMLRSLVKSQKNIQIKAS